MSTFFTSFGVNGLSLLFYVILFFLVFLLLRRFAFGPILGTIEARQKKIEESLDEAKAARDEVASAKSQAEEILRQAAAQSQEALRKAEKLASELADQARAEARTQADLMVVRARQEIDRERQAAVAEVRAQVVDLALLAAGRVIERNLDADTNRKLIEETIQQAELRA